MSKMTLLAKGGRCRKGGGGREAEEGRRREETEGVSRGKEPREGGGG